MADSTFTYAQLKQALTEDEALRELKEDVLDEGGVINTTDWTPGSFQRTLLMMGAHVYSVMTERNAAIAKSTNLTDSTGDGLTVLALSVYDKIRREGVKTQGTFGLDLTISNNAWTFAPYGLMVSDGTHFYKNVNAATINSSNPHITMSFEAVDVGANYNIDNRDWNNYLNLVTSVNGVVVNTTPAAGGTWITRPGTDTETDPQLIARCAVAMSETVTSELVEDRVKAIALTVPGIFSAAVDDEYTSVPGSWNVHVAGDLYTATPDQVTEVYERLTGSIMNGAALVNVYPASASIFDTQLTLYYKQGYTEEQVRTQVSGTLDLLISGTPVGGFTFGNVENVFNTNDLVAAVENLPCIRKVAVFPTSDISLFNNGQPAKLTRPSNGYSPLLTFVKS